MISQERINRSFADQIRNLTAERDRLAQELNQYRIDQATATIRGLEVLTALAAAGNPAARLAIKTLLETLETARSALSNIVVVKS